mgnify:CR=1 FL=1
MNWIDEVNFNEEGLVPVIVQDVKTSRVLMLGWANREALESTVATGRGVYFSRSRGQVWCKGSRPATIRSWWACSSPRMASPSSNRVGPAGRVASHTGHASCYWRELVPGGWRECEPVVRAPEDMYEK